MTKIIQYIYYRIASVAWNASSWGKSVYDGFAYAVLGTCITFNALLIFSILRYAITGAYPSETIDFFLKTIYIPLMIVSVFFLHSKDKKAYKKLEAKYKNDQYRELKGWLIAIYCILSFFSVVIVSCLFPCLLRIEAVTVPSQYDNRFYYATRQRQSYNQPHGPNWME